MNNDLSDKAMEAYFFEAFGFDEMRDTERCMWQEARRRAEERENMNKRDYEKQMLAIAQEQYEAGRILRASQINDWRAELVVSDFETIVLALEREHFRTVDLLNSGKVIKDVQDRALRDRDYKIEELLKRLGVNPEQDEST